MTYDLSRRDLPKGWLIPESEWKARIEALEKKADILLPALEALIRIIKARESGDAAALEDEIESAIPMVLRTKGGC